MTVWARKWSNSLGPRNDPKAQIQRSHQVLESAFPTPKRQKTWSPRWVKGQSRDLQTKGRILRGNTLSEWTGETPTHRTRRWRYMTSLALALSGTEKVKTSPSLFITTDPDFGVWGLNIYNYRGWKKTLNF